MKTQPAARVIADSISIDGDRLVTVEATMHRFVLAELNTHRAFSRNSASSRAIPVAKQLAKVQADPAMPIEWGTNQRGMQAAEPLEGMEADQAAYAWLKARDEAFLQSRRMSEELNVHKQVANRILEPWMWHTVIITSTDWDNFFGLRCSPLAQPEIRVVAELIRDAIGESVPVEVRGGGWHLPYIQEDELDLDIELLKKLSAARCARVSYLTHDGVRDHDKDLELYERLTTAQPPHASPLEHVATPDWNNKALVETEEKRFFIPVLGNFLGWRQLRHEVAGIRLAPWVIAGG